jgi:hypothetical protein
VIAIVIVIALLITKTDTPESNDTGSQAAETPVKIQRKSRPAAPAVTIDTVSERETIVNDLQRWGASMEAGSLEEHISYYAPYVTYFKKRLTIDAVKREKYEWFARGWIKNYNLISDFSTHFLSDTKCEVYYTANYDYYNTNNNKKFSAIVLKRLELTRINSQWKISLEKDVRIMENRNVK